MRQLTQLERLVHAVIKKRYNTLSVLEEDVWRQRAITKWELQGDQRTRYFHAIASKTKRTNSIATIEHEGMQYSDQTTKAAVFFEFFASLMGTNPPPLPTISWSTLYGTGKDMHALVEQITMEEIAAAIKQWPNNKSSGPDGFSGEFYKYFANMIIPDLHAVFAHVTTTSTTLHPLNSSYTILIPKKETPTTPSDFRPISLLHGVQKLFSKILANRLQPHMQHLISDVQTGFQKGRQMTESYIYTQHLLHYARKQKIPMALLKLDIRKAFDTINWEFALQVMDKLGFPVKWVEWIKNAVLQGSAQVLINGLLGKKINCKRGVRQGDPLSPTIFILAMNFLARYLIKLTHMGAIRLPFHNMEHCLLYADDALLFIKPTPNKAQVIKIALLVFQQISGLAINLEKSDLLVTNVEEQQANDI